MKKIILLSLILLCGCRLVNERKMEKSGATYMACLKANDGDEAECKIEKTQYEIDFRQYQNTGNGLLGGNPSQAPRSSNTDFEGPQPQQWIVNSPSGSMLCNNYGGTVNCN